MAVVQREVRERAVPPEPRVRPALWGWVRRLGYVGLVLPVVLLGAVLQGFLLGESDPEKYRPFAPGPKKKR